MSDKPRAAAWPQQAQTGLTGGAIARTVSLLLALLLTFVCGLFPQLVASGNVIVMQALMPVMLFGMMGGYVHGMGYGARRGLAALLLGPSVAWPVMLSTLMLMVLKVLA